MFPEQGFEYWCQIPEVQHTHTAGVVETRRHLTAITIRLICWECSKPVPTDASRPRLLPEKMNAWREACRLTCREKVNQILC